MYELFTSGIFHLMFLDLSGLQVTETTESEITDKGERWDTAISIYGTKVTAWNETGEALICIELTFKSRRTKSKQAKTYVNDIISENDEEM